MPVLLEDQQDADGKARAIRIGDGQFVKDASGKELRFGDSDLNTADTDMRLRSAIQQVLDTLSLSDPDPDARYSAVDQARKFAEGILHADFAKSAGQGKNRLRQKDDQRSHRDACN